MAPIHVQSTTLEIILPRLHLFLFQPLLVMLNIELPSHRR